MTPQGSHPWPHWTEQVSATLLGRYRCAAEGSIAIKFALMVPVLMMAAGGAIDYGITQHEQARLQAAIDAGSLAAAKELGLADAKSSNVQAVVESVVRAYLAENHDKTFAGGKVSVTATVHSSPLEVAVSATQEVPLPFNGILGTGSSQLAATSVARITGKPNICVLGLDPSEPGTVSLMNNASVTGQDCAVFSNSSHTSGLKAKNSSRLTANLICSRGGKDADPGVFSPDPVLDCPSFEDPIASRPEPSVGACQFTNLVVSAETRSLSPGTYCGGLKITKTSDVTLSPGIYVIKDGPLIVDGDSKLTGTNTGFFFTGSGATFDFTAKSSISLTAPEDGPLAGLLMFEGHSQPKTGMFKISSNDARVLIGTIYLPNSELKVDATAPVADQSAYTAIVARAMRLYGGPNLILNTNYDQTTVPVPEGIKGAGQPVSLVE